MYSTNPDFVNRFFDEEEEFTPDPEEQSLRIWLDRIKGNKVITIVKGFEGSEDNREKLGKLLKKKCGAGGSVKDNEIFIQGDHRNKVLQILKEQGYTKTKKAGG